MLVVRFGGFALWMFLMIYAPWFQLTVNRSSTWNLQRIERNPIKQRIENDDIELHGMNGKFVFLFRNYLSNETIVIRSGSTKMIHLVFLFGLELGAKMLEQIEFYYKGNTFQIHLSIYAINSLARKYHNPKIYREEILSDTLCEKIEIIFLVVPHFSKLLEQLIRNGFKNIHNYE